MFNPDTVGALYLTIFRLAVIIAGIVSIWCGYRLFLAGAFGQGFSRSESDIGARLGGMQLTLKSAAPGTCFAFFGAFIIGAMMVSAPPQFSRSHMVAALPGGEAKDTEVVTMRGQSDGLVGLVEEAKRAEKMGDRRTAIKDYESALRLVAEPLNNLAFLYHETGHDSQGLPLARLAIQFAPNEPEFIDTLNRVQGGESK